MGNDPLFIYFLPEPSPSLKQPPDVGAIKHSLDKQGNIKKKKLTTPKHTTHTHSHYTAIINLRNETSPLLQARKQAVRPRTKLQRQCGYAPETVAPPWLCTRPLAFCSEAVTPGFGTRVTGTCGAVCSPPAGLTQGGPSWRFHYPPRQACSSGLAGAQSSPCKCSHIVTLDSELGP